MTSDRAFEEAEAKIRSAVVVSDALFSHAIRLSGNSRDTFFRRLTPYQDMIARELVTNGLSDTEAERYVERRISEIYPQ